MVKLLQHYNIWNVELSVYFRNTQATIYQCFLFFNFHDCTFKPPNIKNRIAPHSTTNDHLYVRFLSYFPEPLPVAFSKYYYQQEVLN